VSTPAQSNQNAGADEQSCPLCVLWNVAFSAMQLEHQPYVLQFEDHVCGFVSLGWSLADALAERGTLCPGCQRSADIYLGDALGDDRRKWRADMWRDNPSMRFMMRPCKGETFQEDQT
jgi:hypothetical protein